MKKIFFLLSIIFILTLTFFHFREINTYACEKDTYEKKLACEKIEKEDVTKELKNTMDEVIYKAKVAGLIGVVIGAFVLYKVHKK